VVGLGLVLGVVLVLVLVLGTRMSHARFHSKARPDFVGAHCVRPPRFYVWGRIITYCHPTQKGLMLIDMQSSWLLQRVPDVR